jgi:transcriptional regulator with XRE-family HTH domain
MEITHSDHNQSLEAYLGTAFPQLRSCHRLTFAGVADRADLSFGMWSNIENNQAISRLKTLAQIAKALGVALSRLFSHYSL